MADIESVQVGTDGSGDYQTIADVIARENIRNLEKVTITPLQDHPHLATNDTINQAFSKTEAWFNSLGQMAFKDNLTKSDVTSALDYDPQKEDEDIKKNFQDSVETICEHIEAKGSPVAEPHSREHVCDAIDAIQAGGNYMTKEIQEDGEYYASDDGVDAYDVVIVSKDVGQPHTVVFYGIDGTTILKTQTNVPYHGYASCTVLDGTTYNGQYFKGWNPIPNNIVRDTQCYPIYGDYVIDSTEIEDDWETICANGGANYPLGSHKSLVVNSFATHTYIGDTVSFYQSTSGDITEMTFVDMGGGYYTIGMPSFAMHMYKVAEGEDGSTSTWLSSKLLNWSREQKWAWTDRSNNTVGYNANSMYSAVYTGQGDSLLRKYLNEEFLSGLPLCLLNNIKPVTKAYTTFARTPAVYNIYNNPQIVERTSIDKVWIPSYKEFHTLLKDFEPSQWHNFQEETQGIDYSSIYLNNYKDSTYDASSPIMLRSCGLYDNWNMRNLIFYPDRNTTTAASAVESGIVRSVPFGFCL